MFDFKVQYADPHACNKHYNKYFIIAIIALMRTDLLALFLAVYRAGSLTAVAKAQNIVPSSISRGIRTLEAHFGARLFHRTTRQLTATEAGHKLYARLVPLVSELDALTSELSESDGTPRGNLKITASVSYGSTRIVPRLQEFIEKHPAVRPDIRLTDEPVDLINESIDVAIRHGVLDDSSLVARKIADVSYHLVASPAYLECMAPVEVPDDLSRHRIATLTFDGFRDQWRLRNGATTRGVTLDPVLRLSNANALRQYVLGGGGIALLADWLIDDDLKKGALRNVLPQWIGAGSSFESSLWLVYPSRSYIPLKARAFAEHFFGVI